MPEAIIKIGSKKPPEPGKKRWKVISFQNEVFQINPELAQLFVEGRSYKVFFENREFQGRHFKEIPGAPELVPEIAGASPNPTAAHVASPAQPPDTQMMIWCCAILKEEVRKGLDARDALMAAEIVEAQKQVYKQCFFGAPSLQGRESPADLRQTEYPKGYKTPPAPRANAYKPGQPASVIEPDLDDEIPFN